MKGMLGTLVDILVCFVLQLNLKQTTLCWLILGEVTSQSMVITQKRFNIVQFD